MIVYQEKQKKKRCRSTAKVNAKTLDLHPSAQPNKYVNSFALHIYLSVHLHWCTYEAKQTSRLSLMKQTFVVPSTYQQNSPRACTHCNDDDDPQHNSHHQNARAKNYFIKNKQKKQPQHKENIKFEMNNVLLQQSKSFCTHMHQTR